MNLKNISLIFIAGVLAVVYSIVKFFCAVFIETNVLGWFGIVALAAVLGKWLTHLLF